MKSTPVLLVHGAFCGGWVWDAFAARLRDAGCVVAAPDLPGHASDDPPGSVAGRSISDYARAIAAVAEKMPSPPVLIGHSLGGLVALLAAARTRTAGVALLAPSPPWGVSGSTMEEAVSSVSLYAFGPYWAQAISPDYPTFRRYAVDRLPRHARHALRDRLVPESGRALFETLNWWLDPFMTTMAQPDRIAAPILAIAGERDVVHPPATVRETARRVGARFESMPDMSHWLPAEPGSDRVADLCLDWMRETALPMAAE
jgi:pimeloyl-ACP methyl ester carboxylesterase